MPAEIITNDRPMADALKRGLRMRCPACGEGHLFNGFLKVAPRCESCGEALYHHRADDAPPYFTILIVGHVVVSLALFVETNFDTPLWLAMVMWPLLSLVLCLALLQPIKGAVVGWQWAHRMHGFDPDSPEAAEPPPTKPAGAIS